MVWVPLAEDDPLPGDPNGLTELADALRREAAEVQGAIDRLNGVDAGTFWEGDAADAFADSRGRLIPDLHTLVERISSSADALAYFALAMGDAQARARAAVLRARDAEVDLTRAEMRLEEEAAAEEAAERAAADWALRRPGEVPPPHPPVWTPNWQGAIDDAHDDLAAARHLFNDAVDDYLTAAHRCAEALEGVADDGLRNRGRGGIGGLFDDVTDGLGNIGGALLQGAETVGRAAAGAAAGIADEAADLTENTANAAAAALNEAADLAQDVAAATLDAAGFVVEHLDVVSDLLGVASMVTGLMPGLQGVSLAISGVKLVLDVGLVLANQGEMDRVWGDLAGFALFGAGRIATGLSRARVSGGALATATKDTEALRRLAAEGLSTSQRAADLTEQVASAQRVARQFSQDAARSAWRQSIEMIRHFGTDLPDGTALAMSRSAARWAAVTEGVGLVSAGMDGVGLHRTLARYRLPGFFQPAPNPG